MPQSSITNRRSRGSPGMEAFLSPRKSFVAVGVACALAAAALLIGGTLSPPAPVGADNPSLDSRAQPNSQEANVAVTVPLSPMNGAHRK